VEVITSMTAFLEASMKQKIIIHGGFDGVERIILRAPHGKMLGLLEFIAPEIERLNSALIANAALEAYIEKEAKKEAQHAAAK
jgi:hypothetical protein